MKGRVGIDAFAGALVVLLSIVVALGAMRFPPSSGPVPGPALFPLLLSALWGPLGLVLLVSGLRQARVVEAESSSPRPMLGLLAMSVIYTLLMPWLGFISSTALYLTLTIGFLGYRHWWRAGAVALSAAFLVFWLFRVVMKVPLPDGWIG